MCTISKQKKAPLIITTLRTTEVSPITSVPNPFKKHRELDMTPKNKNDKNMKPKYMCAAKYIFSFKILFTKSWMLYEREREQL